jgi:uncharacterized coiled-coil DUF342 family protein
MTQETAEKLLRLNEEADDIIEKHGHCGASSECYAEMVRMLANEVKSNREAAEIAVKALSEVADELRILKSVI